MKDDYDFSNGQRGTFFQKDAALKIPVNLEPDVRHLLSERARAKGLEIGDLVNELLKRDIEMISAAN